jgi:hypothetical protein
MSLNRRHKAILFLTLVITGCSLLVGAELKEALGFMMLGVALAWAIGSDTATKFYSGLKNVSGSFYSWIRLPLVMALVGAFLGAVLLYSHANPVLAIACMCAAGIVVAPLTPLPTQRIWLRIPLVLLAAVAFVMAAFGIVSTDLIASNRFAGRMGQLTVPASVALLVGIFWLSKGWKQIEKGITAQPVIEITPQEKKRAWGQYVSLFIGIGVLTLWLSLLSWLATGSWEYAPEKVVVSDKNDSNLLVQAGFIVLLAAWPYAAWKLILNREPNSEPRFLKRHQRVAMLAGMIFVLALGLAITFGIQNGNDRLLTDEILARAGNLRTVAEKIGAIKQRDMKTTGDYIEAYSEIEALLPEYEDQIQKYKGIFKESEERDKSRGPINIQRFYKSHNPEMWKNDLDMVNVLDEIDSLTRQETLTVKEMAALPAQSQPDFWRKEFRPLLMKEDTLREKAITLQAKHEALLK